jgi:hypothetical protein
MAKTELKLLHGPSRSDLFPGMRCIKVFRPKCETCQRGRLTAARWWETCEHEPYFTTFYIPITEDETRMDENGDLEVIGQKTKKIKRQVPNTGQVMLDIGANSGEGLRKAKEEKGFKEPEEMGYAPICQYRDCWTDNPSHKHARYGDYCREMELRVIAAQIQGIKLEQNIAEKRAQQLASVAI